MGLEDICPCHRALDFGMPHRAWCMCVCHPWNKGAATHGQA